MRYLIILMYMAIFSRQVSYGDRILYVLEGEVAKLDFPYPCDSTKVTLRDGYRVSFYISDPLSLTLPSRYELASHINDSAHSCSLHLTINPVSRNDEDTYILMAYKDGVMLPDYPRIGLRRLRVNYPPGKASCKLSSDYNDGEWVSLQCTATVGNLAGQIVCYQDDMKLPSLIPPEENDKTLNQIILTRLAGLVYCCSSTLGQTKDRCECNDFRWNPIQNTELSNIPEPCATTTQIPEQESITSKGLGENNTNCTTASDSQTARNTCTSMYTPNHRQYAFITVVCLIVLGSIIGLLYYLCNTRKQKKLSKNSKETSMNTDDLQERDKLA